MANRLVSPLYLCLFVGALGIVSEIVLVCAQWWRGEPAPRTQREARFKS